MFIVTASLACLPCVIGEGGGYAQSGALSMLEAALCLCLKRRFVYAQSGALSMLKAARSAALQNKGLPCRLLICLYAYMLICLYALFKTKKKEEKALLYLSLS